MMTSGEHHTVSEPDHEPAVETIITPQDTGATETIVQPDNITSPEIYVIPPVAAIKETKVRNYDPKKLVGPLTPAQMSLYDAFMKVVKHGYPSKESLSKARAREICYMGGRALRTIPPVPPLTASEILL